MSIDNPEDGRFSTPGPIPPGLTSGDSARETEHTIAVAQVTFEGLFAPDSVRQAVNESWTPGLNKDLYRRRWILTRILEESPQGYFGKIGFVREGEVNTLAYDEERGDFIEGQAPTGVTVPFFLSIDGRISFQLISNVVRESTFIRAFSELMNSSDANFDWVLTPLRTSSNTTTGYKPWSASLDSISLSIAQIPTMAMIT